jgi:hypothetical protein
MTAYRVWLEAHIQRDPVVEADSPEEAVAKAEALFNGSMPGQPDLRASYVGPDLGPDEVEHDALPVLGYCEACRVALLEDRTPYVTDEEGCMACIACVGEHPGEFKASRDEEGDVA